jgi:hypothetical protein
VGQIVRNAAFGEIFVDVIWSTDAQLDEFLADAKAALSGSEQTSGGQQTKDTPKKDVTDGVGKAARLRQSVEQDKDTLSELVKRFLVSISAPHASSRVYSEFSATSSRASLTLLYVESASTCLF